MNKPLLTRETYLLWIGFILMAVVPQLSIWRVGPLAGFFLESGTLLFALITVLLTIFAGYFRAKIPVASVYFLLLAIFWALQARVMNLTYIALSDVVAWTFVVIALLMWACRGWVAGIGQERSVSILAYVLFIGAILQAVIGWLQYTDFAKHFSGILMYRKGIVEGQFGQRNHFAHYLMWGNLSIAWLWAQRRLPVVLAVLGALFLSATMGLTGSRTIFAYILALVILLAIYLMIMRRESQYLVWRVAGVAMLVLVCQFALEPILMLFRESDIQSAAERLGQSSFGGSGRGYEWRKAWQIFLSAPLWGYGWGSYAWQGFVTNVYPNGFRPYETSVLFTHSHNSFLNLLAEMGLVGTGLVLGGLLYSIRGCLNRKHAPVSLLLLAWLSVSLMHSMVEYPLWYIYFLVPFSLFIGLMPTAGQAAHQPIGSSHIAAKMVLMMSFVLMGGIVRLAIAYQNLRHFSGSSQVSVANRTVNIVGLLNVAEKEPMLRYYAQLQLMNYLNPNDQKVPDWAMTASRDNMRYRPYANAHKYAFVAYRLGKEEEAKRMMQLMYRYYPSKMMAYGNPIMNTPFYFGLRDDYTHDCHAYYHSLKQIPNCAKAIKPTLPMLPKNKIT